MRRHLREQRSGRGDDVQWLGKGVGDDQTRFAAQQRRVVREQAEAGTQQCERQGRLAAAAVCREEHRRASIYQRGGVHGDEAVGAERLQHERLQKHVRDGPVVRRMVARQPERDAPFAVGQPAIVDALEQQVGGGAVGQQTKTIGLHPRARPRGRAVGWRTGQQLDGNARRARDTGTGTCGAGGGGERAQQLVRGGTQPARRGGHADRHAVQHVLHAVNRHRRSVLRARQAGIVQDNTLDTAHDASRAGKLRVAPFAHTRGCRAAVGCGFSLCEDDAC